ncbi:two component, sigma54 specific, transcriptional regulator, Fis family [Desulfuromusa kysingii]|uniref:Two component, sigma54 specific, transcriptional regulator, Fis family n=1 Tax=Desulfuromusa kysingii TaxID=37625 RepID=A0A1H3WZT1_9BACT|nr:two component, sigma54 specific, transcriptional regulator, Fis family [Desulfuromusa kysingii]
MGDNRYPAFGVLLVDDEQPWLRSLSLTLEGPGGITNLLQCADSREVMTILEQQEIGLILLDLTMPHRSGEELLGQIVAEYPHIRVIILSGMNQLETAVSCMRAGAFDYFVKTVDEDRLVDGVRRAIKMIELESENHAIRRRFFYDQLDNPEVFAPIVTNSAAMRARFQYIEAVAPSTQPILITGESGVGKELVAQAIHTLSAKEGSLVSINVAGLDDNVFADTLFGHVRGAFTGAENIRKGMIEAAAGGTLFLDEIGDLSSASQVKLLRLLQNGEYYPLGSDQPKQMTARVVVATHADLDAKMAAGTFRRDLYYRLYSHHVHLPPLRERKDDLALLLDHFLTEAAVKLGKKKPTPPKELVVLLSTYSFPGNIRELEAMVYDAVSQHNQKILSMKSFLARIDTQVEPLPLDQTHSFSNPFSSVENLPTLQQAGKLLVEEAMNRSTGNQSIAARLLGISQPALSKRLK